MTKRNSISLHYLTPLYFQLEKEFELSGFRKDIMPEKQIHS